MRKFFIITNEHKDKELTVTKEIQNYIISQGGECDYFVSREANWHTEGVRRPGAIEDDVDCILVLGGDGTLVRAARDLAELDIPLIGVNLGTLGYLCELERSTVFSAVDRMMEDAYDIESRMLLEGCEIRNENFATVTNALNDIVIHRMGSLQLVNLEVSVNGEYLTTYGADGIIISTPTGSTGYSMSAGGPIVDPKADLIVITPINSHDISSKSIVVGSDASITIELVQRRAEKDEIAEVSFDGDRIIHMRVGDKILVRKAEKSTKILKLNRVSFLQILRKKMQH